MTRRSEQSLLCQWKAGCNRPWTCDCGRGRLCSEHDLAAQQHDHTRPKAEPARAGQGVLPLPLRDAVPHWSEAHENPPETDA